MAAICLSASFVLIPEQAAAKYSRYEASREAVNASASPGVNSTSLTSFTRTLATSSFGVPQQFLYFFPEPHPHGSLRPISLLILPSRRELYPSHNAQRTISAQVGSAGHIGRLWQIGARVVPVASEAVLPRARPLAMSNPNCEHSTT